jgi:HlyD family secretion protein
MPAAAASPSPPPATARRSRRLAIVLVGITLVALAGVAWWWLGTRGEATNGYRFAKVERGAITSVVSASGTLSAVTTVAVGSQISGQIKELSSTSTAPCRRGSCWRASIRKPSISR